MSLGAKNSVAKGLWGLQHASFIFKQNYLGANTLRDDYLEKAREIIQDPNVLVNMVSRRCKQLRQGAKPLVYSLERLDTEDVALREIIEGKISSELWTAPEQED